MALEDLFATTDQIDQVIISIKQTPSLQLTKKAGNDQSWDSTVHIEHWFKDCLALQDACTTTQSP